METGSVATVKIHGRDYVPVAERVRLLHQAHPEAGIDTQVVENTAEAVTVRAVVEVPGFGRYTVHATSDRRAQGIEGESPLEVAETSAVGRALGFAGIGFLVGIATANEVMAARAGVNGDGPAMPAQVAYLTKLGIEASQGLTKGEASRLIDDARRVKS